LTSNDADLAVSTWLARTTRFLDSQGFISQHGDDLLQLENGHQALIAASFRAFAALIRHGDSLALQHRLCLSFTLREAESAVPLTDNVRDRLWSELDPYTPPELFVLDLTTEHLLFDEEHYEFPLPRDERVATDAGVVAVSYVASRSREYRESGQNYSRAIVFQFYPPARLPTGHRR
jgi:hypothetical protein